jgi:hypothetical protein
MTWRLIEHKSRIGDAGQPLIITGFSQSLSLFKMGNANRSSRTRHFTWHQYQKYKVDSAPPDEHMPGLHERVCTCEREWSTRISIERNSEVYRNDESVRQWCDY